MIGTQDLVSILGGILQDIEVRDETNNDGAVELAWQR
jgi:hypothetical protein